MYTIKKILRYYKTNIFIIIICYVFYNNTVFSAIFCNNTSIGCVKEAIYLQLQTCITIYSRSFNCDRILSRIYPKFHKYGNLSSTLMLWGESMPWKSYTSYANFSQVFASYRLTWNTNCCLHRPMYHTETPF